MEDNGELDGCDHCDQTDQTLIKHSSSSAFIAVRSYLIVRPRQFMDSLYRAVDGGCSYSFILPLINVSAGTLSFIVNN